MTTRSFCVVTILGLMIGAAAGARPGLEAQVGTAAQSPTCIAVPLPSMTGVPGRVEDVGNGVRDLFATYLTAPAFKIVPLDARLPALALDEARQKGCANVLTVTISGKQSGGSRWGKLAGQAAGTAAVYVPGSANTGAAMVRGAAVGTGYAVSSFASTTKVRDELTLEYKLQASDPAVKVAPGKQQTKAKVDGEDILTPLVEGAAGQIAAALLKR